MTQFNASLWGDEGWAATLAVKPIVSIVRIVARDTSPPLYYLCLHTWMKIFGTSEVAIRSLSFLFFLGTALTAYFIGKHLWDKKTGFLAAVITFLSPFLFKYAFEGRMYAILAFTSTLAVFFFLKKNYWAFIFSGAAALYSHHFSIFILVWLGLWRLKELWGKPLKKVIVGLSDFLIIGLLYIPWLYPLYYQTSLVASGFWLGKPTPKVLTETIGKFLAGEGKETTRKIAWTALFVILILRKWLKDKEKSAFLLGWFLSPLVITYLLSQIMQPIFFDRYMLAAIPAACLLIASLVRKVSLIPLTIALICLAILNWHYFTHPTKRPFREMADFIKSEASNLTLINYNAAAHHLWESKYYGLEAPIYTPKPLPFYTGTALMEEGDIIYAPPAVNELGAITSAPLEEVKISGYDIFKEKQFGALSLLWLKRHQGLK